MWGYYSRGPPAVFFSYLHSLIQRCTTTFISTPATAKPSLFRKSNIFLQADRLAKAVVSVCTHVPLCVHTYSTKKGTIILKVLFSGAVLGAYKP